MQLSDGSRVPADVVVAATGFDQDLSLLDASVRERLLDADGVMALHRRILPAGVPRLAFAGWGNTYRSPCPRRWGRCGSPATWRGWCPGPRRDEVQRTGHRFHLTHRQAAAHRQQQVPSGSFAVLDQMLDDLGLPLPAAVRRGQWTKPLTPSSYAYLVPALRARVGAVAERASVTAH